MPARLIYIICGAGIVAGKEIVSLHLGRALRDAGWEPRFITSQWSDGEFVRRLEEDSFIYKRLRIGFISASLRFLHLFMTLEQLKYWPGLAIRYARLVATTAPQAVIHTNWHHVLLLLPFLSPRRDIFWVHETVANTKQYRVIFRSIAKRVGRIVCVSHAVSNSILALGVHPSRITVIHNGLPPCDPAPLHANHDVLRIGIVGQIGPWKGHEDLLNSLALLRDDQRANLRIYGAGNPGYIEHLRERVAALGLERRVEWCGMIKRQADIYRDIDVCSQPSQFDEPFGMATLEAGAFGRPTIVTSRGGLPEIVKDGVTGFVVKPGCPRDLARAIEAFVQERSLVKSMGEAAYKRVHSDFSLQQCVSKFIEVINGLTTENSALGRAE